MPLHNNCGAIQPFFHAFERFRFVIEPLCGAIQPFCRAVQPFSQGDASPCHAIEPFRRAIQLFRREIQLFRREIQPSCHPHLALGLLPDNFAHGCWTIEHNFSAECILAADKLRNENSPV